jgi:myosin heavy subunit
MKQLTYSGVLAALDIRRSGFPSRIFHLEFLRMFWRFLTISKRKSIAASTVSPSLDVKTEVSKLLSKPSVKAVVNGDEWAIGRTKVFLKSDVIPKLEGIEVC